MAQVAFSGEQWFVTSDDATYKILGPMTKDQAAKFVLLLKVIQDGVDAADLDCEQVNDQSDDYWYGGLLPNTEAWAEEAARLVYALENPVQDTPEAARLGLTKAVGLTEYPVDVAKVLDEIVTHAGI